MTPGKKRWQVSYQLLYPIIDGEQIETIATNGVSSGVSPFIG